MGTAATGDAHHLEAPGCAVLVVGCGNLLRGDDGVGPVLVRHLWERGVPGGARLVDGGTAGMDVAFQMRGAERVVIVDAAATGSAPGTIFKVPAAELVDLPPLQGLHTHSFRWDHAVAFARWALGEDCPTDITVYLIEVQGVELGADLSAPVQAAMELVVDRIEADHLAVLRPAAAPEVTVEFTADGYLRLDAGLAASRFPSDAVAALVRDDDLWLIPLRGPRSGGLLLKQRNPAGDRSLLIREVIADRAISGVVGAFWDDATTSLRIPLRARLEPPG
ncbi:hydrogenase maturation protease [Mycobacterium sherrisii]|uniref:Peptidase M52 n=1 Tax=Mycobacterium sherrisii TaxID=243061 RepID=A0A1E3SWN8_9MYCO|nr:hydrogenase maturation protease [Mycobacterium sherrisii]MCV7031944.1 hydrogenase maturation protease [Mycobacterium sherrisii]ODR06574.1 peptidase M52 [Mycobacterium sherrisii]ORW85750.1 peptidase M52 [Mycobacterium sherrisii]